jgi:hypothetical protein
MQPRPNLTKGRFMTSDQKVAGSNPAGCTNVSTLWNIRFSSSNKLKGQFLYVLNTDCGLFREHLLARKK